MKRKDEFVRFTTATKVDRIEIEIDEDLGGVRFGGKGAASTERSYPRPKGDKIVSRIPSGDTSARFSRDDAVEKNYDLLLAVDTNYRKLGEDLIAATAVIGAKMVLLGHPENAPEMHYSYFPLPSALFRNPTISPEKLGWDFAIQCLFDADVQSRFPRIGVVVDAHLSDITEINARNMPVAEDRHLPDKVTLIYASAERGKDDFINKFMHYADASASLIFKQYESRRDSISIDNPSGYACAGFVQIIGANTINHEEI